MAWLDRIPLPLLFASTLIGSGCSEADPPADDPGSSTASPADSDSSPSDTATSSSETEATQVDPAVCQDAIDDVAAFVDANASCERHSDCRGLSAFCYPGGDCGVIAVNVEADETAWADIALDAACSTADQPCGADPCGACVYCDQGRCATSVGDCPSDGDTDTGTE